MLAPAPYSSLPVVVETHESPEDAYRQTLAFLRGKTRPDALYISTANSLPVLRALEEHKLLGRVQVVTTDLFHELIPILESGKYSRRSISAPKPRATWPSKP